MKKVSRRTFLCNSIVLGKVASSRIAKSAIRAADGSYVTGFEAHEKSFMDQYYDGILCIVRGIRDTQKDKIAGAMEKAYELKRKGGSIYSHMVVGHYAMFAGSSDRPGQPMVLPQSDVRSAMKEIETMKNGDFLITNAVFKGSKELRKRDIYVVGVTNNFYRFHRTPPDALLPRLMETSIEDISDVVIDNQMPWDNGLVSAPQIPHFKICPSTGIAQFLVYWACTASLASLIGTKGKGSSTEPAERYLDMEYDRFQMIGTDSPKIDWVAEKWADLVLNKKARLLVYGHPQNVGPYGGSYSRHGIRNMFVNDACICASGSMIADQYEPNANNLHEGDIVLIGAFTSDNPLEITAARNARRAGAYTVAFCPYMMDGDSSGLRLFKEVDDAFNTYSDESAGVIAVKGLKQKVSPLSGLTGSLVHWLLTAQWADHMARRGKMPYFWQAFEEKEGRAYDNAVRPYFLERGY